MKVYINPLSVLDDISRVTSVKILGVTIANNASAVTSYFVLNSRHNIHISRESRL